MRLRLYKTAPTPTTDLTIMPTIQFANADQPHRCEPPPLDGDRRYLLVRRDNIESYLGFDSRICQTIGPVAILWVLIEHEKWQAGRLQSGRLLLSRERYTTLDNARTAAAAIARSIIR